MLRAIKLRKNWKGCYFKSHVKYSAQEVLNV